MNNQKLIQLLSNNLMSNKPSTSSIDTFSHKKSKMASGGSRNKDTISVMSKNQRVQSLKTIQTQRESSRNAYSSGMGSRAKSELCVSDNGSKIRYRQSGYDSEMTPVRNHSKQSLSNRKMRPFDQNLKLPQPRKPSLSKDSNQSTKKKDIVIEASTSIFDHQIDPNQCSQLKLQINDRVIDLRELLLNNNNSKAPLYPSAMTPGTKDLQDITNIEIKLGKQSSKKKRRRSSKKSQRKVS